MLGAFRSPSIPRLPIKLIKTFFHSNELSLIEHESRWKRKKNSISALPSFCAAQARPFVPIAYSICASITLTLVPHARLMMMKANIGLWVPAIFPPRGGQWWSELVSHIKCIKEMRRLKARAAPGLRLHIIKGVCLLTKGIQAQFGTTRSVPETTLS